MTTLARRRKRPVTLGPADHGRRMSLALFDAAQVVEGTWFELNRGVVEMMDVPSRSHALALNDARNQFLRYFFGRPEMTAFVTGGMDSKVSAEEIESQRHPDLSVYLTPMPELEQPWSIWRPQIVVEVVSPSSIKRDYEDKPPEYLALGISEYWILDPKRRQLLVKQNVRGVWRDKTHKPSTKPVTSPLLPGFAFDLKRTLNAAK